MDLKTFAPEQRIFHEGDRSDYAYIVEYGNVQIYRELGGRAVRLAVLGKGDISARWDWSTTGPGRLRPRRSTTSR